MSKQSSDRAIITWAVGLLKAGILPSAIPGRLMDEYGLTPERARELAAEAIKRRRIETQNVEKPGG